MKTLLIEDEFVSLEKLVALLCPYGHVSTATNGKHALDLFGQAIRRGKPFDLVTFDLGLPDIPGHTLIRSMNKLENGYKTKPCVKFVISGNNDHASVMNCAKLCHAFIVKPIRRELFIDRLEQFGLIPAEATLF